MSFHETIFNWPKKRNCIPNLPLMRLDKYHLSPKNNNSIAKQTNQEMGTTKTLLFLKMCDSEIQAKM